MAVTDVKFSNFADGGDLEVTDIVVGLRNGVNTRFNYTASPGLYLPLAGGTMAGIIDMNGNFITNLPTPVNPNDAVPKSYVDALGTPSALTKSDDTNVTLTLGGTPATALLEAVSLTLGWSGQLSVSRGGTGNSTFTPYSLICAGTTATGAFQNVSGVGTLNQVLVSQGAGALPIWSSVPGVVPAAMTRVDDTNVTLTLGGTPATSLLQAVSLTLGWTGTLSPTRGGTGVNNGTSTITVGGNFAMLGAFTFDGTLTGNTAVTFPTSGTLATTSQIPTGAALTRVDDTNVTLTLGGSPTTALVNAASLTLGWTGTLSGTRGGTGVNNGSNTATFAGNLNFAAAFTTSGAFAVTQTYTGITNVTFPTSGTLATTSQLPTPAALTKTDDTNVTLTLGGTPATALLQATSLTLGWSGQLAVSRGGTGLASATAYAVLCGGTTSTGAFQSVASVGTSGQVLTSNGAGALPTFQSIVASSAFNQIHTQTITTTGAFTYTPTTGTKYAIFELQGGGGGSGGTTGTGGQSCMGGSGGGGAYIKLLVSGSSNLSSITGSVGIAGTAGASGNNSGGNGGDTTLVVNSGTTWTASGGIAGTGQTSSAAAKVSGTPGSGGGTSNGTNATLIVAISGGPGDWGATFGNVNYYASAAGGGSILASSTGNAQSISGRPYGGGSSGFFNFSGANAAGFAGGEGVVIVTEFISA